jgi:hypothetical protein
MANTKIKMFCVSVSMVEAPSESAILDQRLAPCKTFRMNSGLQLAATLGLSGLLCAAAAAFDDGKVGAARIDDPFTYCGSVGTQDATRRLPANLNVRAAAALEVNSADAISGGYFWRCLDGAVYVCTVGANLPCQSKADRARRNPGAEAFCRDNRDADVVPAYAAGHRTIYAWRCISGRAVHGEIIVKLDRRGFQLDLWRRLQPAGSG